MKKLFNMICTEILLLVTSLAATIGARTPRLRHSKQDSAVEVTLAPAKAGAAAELVATVKNVGSTDLNMLKVGTLLDETLPIRKVLVVDGEGVEAPFRGIHASIQYDALTAKHFRLLKASESMTIIISVATVHEFTKSGKYTFSAAGLLPVNLAGSAEPFGLALPCWSNSVGSLC
ncbi:hypothetical protein F5Y13DRAFT_207190 [Hypoxylon sp. FL1857]|nr:hypothetical protein F5Y13DRAFT_207190 [Hypoxylon sp. FL1857]